MVKIARDFHKNLVFVGYFTPVTLNLSNVIVFMSKKKICWTFTIVSWIWMLMLRFKPWSTTIRFKMTNSSVISHILDISLVFFWLVGISIVFDMWLKHTLQITIQHIFLSWRSDYTITPLTLLKMFLIQTFTHSIFFYKKIKRK